MTTQPTLDSIARFAVLVSSGHPRHGEMYDARKARYRPEYVHKTRIAIGLDASPGLPGSRAMLDPMPAADGTPEEGGDQWSHRSVNATVPEVVTAYEWSVKQLDGSFEETIIRTRSDKRMWFATMHVPPEGQFRITLRVRCQDGATVSSTRSFRLRDLLIVSIGDSFSSGQGNPDKLAKPSPSKRLECSATTFTMTIEKLRRNPIVGILTSGMDLAGEIVGGWVDFFVDLFGGSSPEPARWQEPRAYRSYNSFASLAAQDVENFSESSADRVTFLSFARSGAEIRAGLLGVRDHGRDEWIGVGEIEEARRAVGNRQIDALIISIGGNDIGFAGSLTDLVIKDLLAWNPVGNDSKERAKTRKKVEQKLENELPQALDDLKRAIDKELAPRQVYILEYPTGLFEKTGPDGKVEDGGPCGIFASSLDMDLDVNDGQAIKALGKKLNALIRDKAQQFGWVFVSGIEAGFAGHGYCDDQTFFVGAEESCRNQGDFEGTMHPNQLGHQVYREQLVQALRLHLFQQAWLEPVLSTMLGTTPTGSWLEPVLNVTMR